MAYQEIGQAIIKEINTHIIYSPDSNENIPLDFAPFIFLIPISFVLRSVINDDNPISPRQEIMIARKEKYPNILPIRCSVRYRLS